MRLSVEIIDKESWMITLMRITIRWRRRMLVLYRKLNAANTVTVPHEIHGRKLLRTTSTQRVSHNRRLARSAAIPVTHVEEIDCNHVDPLSRYLLLRPEL